MQSFKEYILESSDDIEVKSDIYDFDNGKLRIRKGQKGKVIKKYNKDYWLIEFNDGEQFSVFHPLLKQNFDKDHNFKKGTEVTASKDIHNMVGGEIYVKKGSEGIVEDCRGKDFIRVGFPSYKNGHPIGVHISELTEHTPS
jgi:hypothetical protein